MRSAPYMVATGTLQGRRRSFSNLGGAEGGALFLGLRYEKFHAETVLYYYYYYYYYYCFTAQ